MQRNEAYKALRLDPNADGQMVEQAYWTLVRQAQVDGSENVRAGHDIDRLNEAYQTLKPGSSPPIAMATRAPVTEAAGQPEIIDRIADWVAEEALRTRERWPDRNPEIALIGGAALFLFLLALINGAHFGAALLGLVIAAAGIWAPWRRDERAAPPAEPIITPRPSRGKRR